VATALIMGAVMSEFRMPLTPVPDGVQSLHERDPGTLAVTLLRERSLPDDVRAVGYRLQSVWPTG
jgi:hypothetical protein